MCRKKKVRDFWILKMNFEDINFVMTPPSVTKKYEKCDSKVHHKTRWVIKRFCLSFPLEVHECINPLNTHIDSTNTQQESIFSITIIKHLASINNNVIIQISNYVRSVYIRFFPEPEILSWATQRQFELKICWSAPFVDNPRESIGFSLASWQYSVVKHVHYLHSSLTKLHFRLDTVLIDKNLWGSNAKKQKKHMQTQNRFSSGFATIFDTDRPVPLAFEGHISTIHEIILSWNLTPWRSIQ